MTRTTFGRYTMLPQLGQGGMGAVYLAIDTVLGRKVALKFLSAQEGDPTLRDRFLLEARAAASIDHPYICKVYEAGELDGEAFIAMEFVEGQTLSHRLTSGALAWPEATAIVIEVCEGLMKAHDRGIVHRDLKPSNIMLVADGHVKVLDFGLAKRIHIGDQTMTDLTGAGMVVGTPGYMSPEQLSGRTLDHRSDVFSLGVILFEMVTAVHPFKRPSSIETMGAILHETPPSLTRYKPEAPGFLDTAVQRMLAKDVHARYASMREVWKDLRQASSSALVAAAAPVVSGKRSIAVLPFVNMSPDPEQEYFSDGITEDIINHLSRVPAFKVVARTSVRRYKNSDKSVAEIGRELGVENILEGSVRRAGNRIRITTGLVEVASEAQTWGKIYDRDLMDIFAIQSDVARNIAEALQTSFSVFGKPPAPERPRNVEAYSLYLRGRFFIQKLTPDGLNKGIRFFEQAIAIDPLDARSHAGLAEAYVNQGHFTYAPPSEAFPRGKAAALRALELDPTLAEPHTSLALAKLFYEWDWQGAVGSIERAIELWPNNVDAAVYHSWTLCVLGRQQDSLAEARRAFELDPLSSMVSSNLAWALANNGCFDESLEQLQRTLEFEPNSMPALAIMSYPYIGKKMYDEAIRYLQKWKWRKTQLSAVLALAGRREEALAILDEVLSGADGPPCWSEVASTYLFLGEREKLAESLDKAYAAREYMLALAAEWSPEKKDPLVLQHLRRMGLDR
ncbi:MAG TPA: hypothetical protein DEQ47_13060 [Solibacterales bacterium]|nr:hypothetical protein [Bryobacterales bacterium]